MPSGVGEGTHSQRTMRTATRPMPRAKIRRGISQLAPSTQPSATSSNQMQARMTSTSKPPPDKACSVIRQRKAPLAAGRWSSWVKV